MTGEFPFPDGPDWEAAGSLPGFEGLPVLFYEDPQEKRRRIAGAQPPPASVLAPRMTAGEPAEAGAAEYKLIDFGWEPWSQGTKTQSLARKYADRLNEIASARLELFWSLLGRLGAPVGDGDPGLADLAALGSWFQDWFVLLGAPYIADGYLQVSATQRLGRVWASMSPESDGYSRSLDALVGSLAHDLAFLVISSARSALPARPELRWQPAYDTEYGRFFVTPEPGPPPADLIGPLVEFIVQSAARPRGSRGRDLRSWYGQTLSRCHDQLVSKVPGETVFTAFPDWYSELTWPRLSLGKPRKGDAPAPPGLVSMAEKFQEAGWFAKGKLSAADIARCVRSRWRELEQEDISAEPDEMALRLLLFDSDRTWSEDVDAGIRPGDGVYGAIAQSLMHVGLKAIRRIFDVEEDWSSSPRELLLIMRGMRGKPKIRIASPAPYISAQLFTGLNELLPADEARMWFVDSAPPLGTVTRATPAERAELERLTGLRLDSRPPAWWTDLAPVPESDDAGTGARHIPAATRQGGGGQADSGRTSQGDGSSESGPRAGQRGPIRRIEGAAAGQAAPPRSGVTAQQQFSRMMRDLVAPRLRELGFTGSITRGFRWQQGDYEATFWTQKSRYSTRQKVEFWVHLGALHRPTNSGYWDMQLHALIPGNTSFSQWVVRADESVEPVADHLLSVFMGYGWPAMQAALDSPGYPPDPTMVWERTFPPLPSRAARVDGPDLGPLTLVLRRMRDGEPDPLAGLADPDEFVRTSMAAEMAGRALDERSVNALLNRLKHDPSPEVRRSAALSLGAAGDRPAVQAALRAAAAQDEDVLVRWACRYMLRLTADPPHVVRSPGDIG